jgi:hypothetical protein
MMRWILLLATIAGIYWLYQNGFYDMSVLKSRPVAAPQPAATLAPGPRPGGGLNPFISDDVGESGGGRPHVPPIPGAH